MSRALQGSGIARGFFYTPHGPIHSRVLHSRAELEAGEGARSRRGGRGEARGGW
jgi:hypothetical protein